MILFIVSRAESPQCVDYYSDNNDEKISANKIVSAYRMCKRRMMYKKEKMSILRIQSIWRKSSANHISIDPMLVADKSEVPKESQDKELSAGMSYGRHTPPWRPTLRNAHCGPKKPPKLVAAAVAVTSSENVEITPAEVMKIPVDPPGVYAEHGGGGGYYYGGGGGLDQNSTKPKIITTGIGSKSNHTPKGILRVKNENQLPKKVTPKMKSRTEAKVEAIAKAKAWHDARGF
jgi:hypothetical protein